MLAPATLNAVLELSPLSNTSVPPDKTGLVPKEISPTLVPLETVEMVVLPEDEPELLPALPMPGSVMSKFQMPDVDVVCVNAKA